MPRSNALVTVVLFAVSYCGFAGCGFAPAAPGGSGASGGPVGTGNASGTALVGGGAAQTGHGAGTGMNCAEFDQPLAKLPPDILIILDKSGSMMDDASGMSCSAQGCTKWEQTTAAIRQVVTDTSASVNWGLKFFASPNGGTCGVNAGADVAIAANNATNVNNAINGQSPGSSTPTRTAVEAGAAYMATVNDANPKFLLLATDGLPNCPPGCSGNACTMTPNPAEATAATNAVATAFGAGFQTFVVGIATSSDASSDQTLSAMANAGGRPRAATPPYYPVMNQAELVTALNQIVVIAGTCIFTIPTPPNDETDAMHIAVKINGAEIMRDTSHSNGWDYSGTNQVEVFGSQCTAIMNGQTQSVQIVFKCRVT